VTLGLQRRHDALGVVALSLTVPPVPQAALSALPSAASAVVSKATPLIKVTALPPRPLVSRETRTTPSPAATAARAFALHTQAFTGWWQSGHMRPDSVE
jgi:hypothetical protein